MELSDVAEDEDMRRDANAGLARDLARRVVGDGEPSHAADVGTIGLGQRRSCWQRREREQRKKNDGIFIRTSTRQRGILVIGPKRCDGAVART